MKNVQLLRTVPKLNLPQLKSEIAQFLNISEPLIKGISTLENGITVHFSDSVTQTAGIQACVDSHIPEKNVAEIQQELFQSILSEVDPSELEQVASMLSWLGEKSFDEVDDWIENNINNVPEIRTFLRILSKVVLANLKMIRIFADRQITIPKGS